MEQKNFESVRRIEQETKMIPFQEVLQESIESVDRELLQSIFDERLRTYGVTSRALVSKDSFTFDLPQELKAFADYSYREQKMRFSPYWLEYRFGAINPRLGICLIECHEQTHHMSHQACNLISEDDQQFVVRNVVGLREAYQVNVKEESGQVKKTSSAHLFTALNEGLTEMFSREILREYLTRDTQYASQESVDNFFEKLPQLEIPYNPVIELVQQLIDAVAIKAVIEQSVVREALYAAMFRGEAMSDPVLVQAFDEMFGEGFTQKFAYHGIKQDASEILNHLAQ
ncbi:MAG: hypothetical protein WCG20_00395 [bacterium]